jgi:hypothetical protein
MLSMLKKMWKQTIYNLHFALHQRDCRKKEQARRGRLGLS